VRFFEISRLQGAFKISKEKPLVFGKEKIIKSKEVLLTIILFDIAVPFFDIFLCWETFFQLRKQIFSV